MTGSRDAIAERLDAACALMREAGALARSHFERRDELAVEFKGTQDVVSAADREVEQLLRTRLGALFPSDGVVGEEQGASGDTTSCWVVDPVDGTQNFLRGLPYWTVVLAYVRDGVCELGLTYDPVHDELFTARRGHGARRDGRPIRCREPRSPAEACVALSFGFKDDARVYVDMQARFLERGVDMRRLGSTALILCHIADGRLDVFYAPGNSSWDCLAGLLTVREAGGVACDFIGEHGLVGRGAAVAAVKPMQALAEELTGVRLV
jgi:myo-inositol-1(or 4)-monophosphatase